MERLTYVKHPRSWGRGKYPTKYTSRHTFEPIDECKECPLCYVDKQRHREAHNDPLTLEEMREMDGEPVYDRMGYEWFIVCEVTDDEVIMTDGTVFDIDEDSPNTVGQRFYRRKPEEGTP